jgi:hypothetical protein
MRLVSSALATLAICLLPSAALLAADPDPTPGDLLVYYGWPSSMNSAQNGWDNALVAVDLGQYDHVVLGAGLEKVAHGDHANTVTILAHPAMGSTFVWGYIDLGVTTQNFSMAEITTRIAEWQATGAHGILLDDFGYDYQTSRARQNAAVDAVHAAGLPVMANGWVPADVFAAAVEPTYNPGGLATRLGASDFYLSESFQLQAGAFRALADWRTKADAIEGYRASLGFGVLSVTTTDQDWDGYVEDQFFYAWFSAAIDGHVAIGWGEKTYSASGANNAIAPYRQRPAVAPGASFTSAVAVADPQVTRDTDLGTLTVDTSAHTYQYEEAASAIPTLGEWALILLAMGMALIAISRLRAGASSASA